MKREVPLFLEKQTDDLAYFGVRLGLFGGPGFVGVPFVAVVGFAVTPGFGFHLGNFPK